MARTQRGQQVVRWAVHPADQARIEQLPGASELPLERLPNPGEYVLMPFLVDPATRKPCHVRVLEVHVNYEPGVHVVVVTREQ